MTRAEIETLIERLEKDKYCREHGEHLCPECTAEEHAALFSAALRARLAEMKE